MRWKCEQCGIEGFLQQIGKNYYRIRHYKGLNPTTRKSEFFYHQQSKEYVEKALRDIKPNDNLVTINGTRTIYQLFISSIESHI